MTEAQVRARAAATLRRRADEIEREDWTPDLGPHHAVIETWRVMTSHLNGRELPLTAVDVCLKSDVDAALTAAEATRQEIAQQRDEAYDELVVAHEACQQMEATRLQVEQALAEMTQSREDFKAASLKAVDVAMHLCERAEAAEASRAAMIVPLAAKIEIAAVHHCCMPSNLQDAPPFSEWCRLIKTWPDEGFVQQFDYECLHCHQKIIVTLKPGLAEARAVVGSPVSEICKEDAHLFGDCKVCGMPHLASRLEPPIEADIKWATESIAKQKERGARLGPAGPPDWQLIETAPKDGTPVLALVVGGAMYVCWFNEKQWCCVDTVKATLFVTPTHWMPLPAPPAGTGDQP